VGASLRLSPALRLPNDTRQRSRQVRRGQTTRFIYGLQDTTLRLLGLNEHLDNECITSDMLGLSIITPLTHSFTAVHTKSTRHHGRSPAVYRTTDTSVCNKLVYFLISSLDLNRLYSKVENVTAIVVSGSFL